MHTNAQIVSRSRKTPYSNICHTYTLVKKNLTIKTLRLINMIACHYRHCMFIVSSISFMFF